jgi:hypothetical protein
LDRFDELLLHTIYCEIEEIFGNRNADVIFDYLEKNGCPRNEIPRKPEILSVKMRDILGCGRGQILGSASILEEAILKAFCIQLKIKFDKESQASFADHIKSIREVYDKEKNARAKHSRQTLKLGPILCSCFQRIM